MSCDFAAVRYNVPSSVQCGRTVEVCWLLTDEFFGDCASNATLSSCYEGVEAFDG